MGSETREAVAGRAVIFDDSFEHEAWNDDDNDSDADNQNRNHRDGEYDYVDESSSSKWTSGGGQSDLPQKEGPDEEGEEQGCSQDEEKGDNEGPRREAGARSGRRRGSGRAAPRVTLIADIWHPDLSDR